VFIRIPVASIILNFDNMQQPLTLMLDKNRKKDWNLNAEGAKDAEKRPDAKYERFAFAWWENKTI